MRDLARTVAQFACEVTIYAAERILEALAAQRPLHDEPLPDGHANHWPDELWTPPGGIRPGTIIFDFEPRDRSGMRLPDGTLPPIAPEYQAIYEEMIQRATTEFNVPTTQWTAHRNARPEMN